MDQEALRQFFWFITERHDIYIRRFVDKKPKPWTKDPILRDFKFTNVYRELDRGTIYLQEKIIGSSCLSDHEKLFNIIVYRWFNRLDTFDRAIGIRWLNSGPNLWDLDEIAERLRDWEDEGHTTFTNEHTVYPVNHKRVRRKFLGVLYTIEEFVLANIGELFQKISSAKKMEEVFNVFKSIPGIGGFLAYEMTIDVNYSDIINFSENDFVNVGPGALQGLRKIFSNDELKERGADARLWGLAMNQDYWFQKFGFKFRSDIPWPAPKPLTLRNIEHSLCEFFKWKRMHDGGRAPRSRFVENSTALQRWK